MIIVEVMPEPRDLAVRRPAVAGRFYPRDPGECRRQAESYLKVAKTDAENSSKWLGAVVPHAGWICSGAIAGQAIATLALGNKADVIVIFGAVHTPMPLSVAALDNHQRWTLPGGDSVVAVELVHRLGGAADLFRIDPRFHAHEHAIEVLLPMVQLAWPGVEILPIAVPGMQEAVRIGRQTAKLLAEAGRKAVYLASSDLTHYGPNYGFTPAGVGLHALEWADENDRRLLRLVTELAADRIVPEVQSRFNACGGGAIAAMLGACLEMGASRAKLLCHANSYQTLGKVAPQGAENAVGYAAVVIG